MSLKTLSAMSTRSVVAVLVVSRDSLVAVVLREIREVRITLDKCCRRLVEFVERYDLRIRIDSGTAAEVSCCCC